MIASSGSSGKVKNMSKSLTLTIQTWILTAEFVIEAWIQLVGASYVEGGISQLYWLSIFKVYNLKLIYRLHVKC